MWTWTKSADVTSRWPFSYGHRGDDMGVGRDVFLEKVDAKAPNPNRSNGCDRWLGPFFAGKSPSLLEPCTLRRSPPTTGRIAVFNISYAASSLGEAIGVAPVLCMDANILGG